MSQIAGRNFPDLIHAFMGASAGTSIPESFARWTAISAIAGAIGRNVWYDFGPFRVHANMFVALVTGPGRGKSVSLSLPFSTVYRNLGEPIGLARDKWSRNYANFGLPRPLWSIQDRITPERMAVDMQAVQSKLDEHSTFDKAVYSAALTMVTSEFGQFMSRNNTDLQMLMTDMWDARPEYSYRTKTAGVVLIRGPCLNWITCATPDQFVEHMPANARSQGLLSRMMIVYYDGPESVRALKYPSPDETLVQQLTHDLAQVSKLYGEIKFEDDELFADANAWLGSGMHPQPTDENLKEYNERRMSHLIKLAIVISISRSDSLTITREDWEEAKAILFDAEQHMPAALMRFGLSDIGKLAYEMVDTIGFKGFLTKPQVIERLMRRVKSPTEATSLYETMLKANMLMEEGSLVKCVEPKRKKRA